MSISFTRLRSLEDKRVRMQFDDGHECIARLVSASQDVDGSLHLVYDHMEWANDPRDLALAKDSTVHAEGEALLSIEEFADRHA